MKSFADLLLVVFTLSFFASCQCEPNYLVDGSTFSFRLIDETTGENVFPDGFDPFDLEIIDDEGDTANIDTRRNDINPDFILDPTGDQRFRYDERFRRRFYLHLDSVDVDTLVLFFVPRRDDCTEYMDDFEAYYNDELVASGSGKEYYGADIIKP